MPRTVQEYIDETPMWADSTAVRYSPMTNMQWLIWGLAAAGKFFEGMVVFTTGVALPLMAQGIRVGGDREGRRRRRLPVRYPDRRHGAGRPGRPIRPQGDVHHRDGAVRHLHPGPHLQRFVSGRGRGPRRHRPCARMRLSDRASDHLREHSEPHSRTHGACGIRLSSRWWPCGHGHRIFDPVRKSRCWRLALDVCQHHPARRAGHHRPFFRGPEPALARLSWAGRRGRGRDRAAAAPRSSISERGRPARPGRGRNCPRTGARACAVVGAVRRRSSAPDHSRLGALVLAGPRHLRHRNLHAHHPGHRDRRQHRAPAQHRRAHPERHPRHQREQR